MWEELQEFFPHKQTEDNLRNLSEHINFQMHQASEIIKINKLTEENWDIYEAIKTLKNAKLPKRTNNIDGNLKEHYSPLLIGQEELEKIQSIINDGYFPTDKTQSNSIQPKAFGHMLFDIHIECEKIDPKMPWYSDDGGNRFQRLSVLIAKSMGIENSSVESLMRRYIKDFSKPERDKQKAFLIHMKEAIGQSKHKIKSPQFHEALDSFINK